MTVERQLNVLLLTAFAR